MQSTIYSSTIDGKKISKYLLFPIDINLHKHWLNTMSLSCIFPASNKISQNERCFPGMYDYLIIIVCVQSESQVTLSQLFGAYFHRALFPWSSGDHLKVEKFRDSSRENERLSSR